MEKNELKWIKQFIHEAIYSVNDIHIISEDEFYFINDHYFTIQSRLLRWIEYHLFLRLGSVGYCRHSKCQFATDRNLAMPNGITVRTVERDDDVLVNRRELLVNESRASRISVYEIDSTGTLTFRQSIQTTANMDNFFIDNNVVFLTGCPNLINHGPVTEIQRYVRLLFGNGKFE